MLGIDNYRVWIEISREKLNQNIFEIKEHVFPAGVFAVLKADAYGFGAVRMAENIDPSLIDGFCVANFEEAAELLQFKKKVYILGGLIEAEIQKAIENNIVLTIIDSQSAIVINNVAESINKIAECQIKIDTGMGRLGILYKDAVDIVEKIVSLKNIHCTGIFSHFPNAYNLNEFTIKQIDLFKDIVNTLSSRGIRFEAIHISNSDGNNNYNNLVGDLPFNFVRTGLNIYGYVDSGSDMNIKIQPIFELKSRLISIKNMPKGSTIGYGSKYILQKDTLVGVITIGYADGLPLNMTNRGFVIVNDVLCPIIGRVSMDYTTISLDACNVELLKIGQEVICIGNSDNHSITLESWAQIKGTHPYDIICSFGSRIKKIFK